MIIATGTMMQAALVALAVVVVTVAIIAIGHARGWRRNGYFTALSTAMIVIAIFILFQTVGGVLAYLTGSLPGKEGVGVLFLAENAITQLAVMLLGTIAISNTFRQDPFAVFRLEGFYETPVAAYVLSVPMILSAQTVGGALSTLWTKLLELVPAIYGPLAPFETQSDSQMQGLVTAHGLPEFAVIFIAVALVPAVAEETLFRGFAQSNIERSGHGRTRPVVALILASVFFAAIHASVFKFPGLLALGLSLGWMAYRTNNLFVGSLGHAVNNGMIVMALYLAPSAAGVGTLEVGVEKRSLSDALGLLAASAPFLLLSTYLFNRVTAGMTARDNATHEIAALEEARQWRSGELPFEHVGTEEQSQYEQSQEDTPHEQ